MSNDNFNQSILDHSEQILDMVNDQLLNHFVDINEMVLPPSDHFTRLGKMVLISHNQIANLRKMVHQPDTLSMNQEVLS